MENKLDILTKKLYDEGIDKASLEAERMISQAKAEAAKVLADAAMQAKEIKAEAVAEVENLKKKAESEMALSARQAVTALKQAVTGLVSGQVAGSMAEIGFEDKTFVRELLVSIVKKWDVASGNLNLEILLEENEKKQFEDFVCTKYKELLDKGLQVKVGELKDVFVIQPKNGGYQIAFSEKLFEAFFDQYIRSFTKSLLYK
ncbi:MAG: V-type ATP synthase subunit E [Odoribacter sp.]